MTIIIRPRKGTTFRFPKKGNVFGLEINFDSTKDFRTDRLRKARLFNQGVSVIVGC